MLRNHWGEFDEYEEDDGPFSSADFVLPSKKAEVQKKIKEILEEPGDETIMIEVKNPLVTQTIEVMYQTELLRTQIDEFMNKPSTSSATRDPPQILPKIEFSPDVIENLAGDGKFSKPLWFIPPIETSFTRGEPLSTPQITHDIAREVLKRAVAGLARIAGYTDASQNTFELLVDAVEEWTQNLLQEMKQAQAIASKDKSNILDVDIVEKGYFAVTHDPLYSLHDYYSTEIIGKNLRAIDEFKKVYNEYEKLRKDSENANGIKEENGADNFDISVASQETNGQQMESTNSTYLAEGGVDKFENNEMDTS